MVSDRVKSSHQFYLQFIWMVCWKSCQTLVLVEHSAIYADDIVIRLRVHVHLLLDGCWIFAVYDHSLLVKLS